MKIKRGLQSCSINLPKGHYLKNGTQNHEEDNEILEDNKAHAFQFDREGPSCTGLMIVCILNSGDITHKWGDNWFLGRSGEIQWSVVLQTSGVHKQKQSVSVVLKLHGGGGRLLKLKKSLQRFLRGPIMNKN